MSPACPDPQVGVASAREWSPEMGAHFVGEVIVSQVSATAIPEPIKSDHTPSSWRRHSGSWGCGERAPFPKGLGLGRMFLLGFKGRTPQPCSWLLAASSWSPCSSLFCFQRPLLIFLPLGKGPQVPAGDWRDPQITELHSPKDRALCWGGWSHLALVLGLGLEPTPVRLHLE